MERNTRKRRVSELIDINATTTAVRPGERLDDENVQSIENDVENDGSNGGSTHSAPSNEDENGDGEDEEEDYYSSFEEEEEDEERPDHAYNLEEATDRASRKDPTLGAITLNSKDIGDTEVERLASALTGNTSVRWLDLSDNVFSRVGAEHLAHALKDNTSLAVLVLDFNANLGPDGAEYIALALKNKKKRKELWFRFSNIGRKGAAFLASALKDNMELKELRLNSNGIDAKGAAFLASALTENSTLKKLYLGNNDIRNKGAASLADALRENTSLEELFLGGNSIENEGAALLASAMEVNKSMRFLGFHRHGNSPDHIDQSWFQKIDIFLKRNKKITGIDEAKRRLLKKHGKLNKDEHIELNADGLADAIAYLYKDEDLAWIAYSVLFTMLQENIEWMFFGGAD